MPRNDGDVVQVNITLFGAIVMEVDEKRNSLTIKLSQFFEWYEPRMRTSKSANLDMKGIVWLSRENINDIWHPDLDMYTDNLEE